MTPSGAVWAFTAMAIAECWLLMWFFVWLFVFYLVGEMVLYVLVPILQYFGKSNRLRHYHD